MYLVTVLSCHLFETKNYAKETSFDSYYHYSQGINNHLLDQDLSKLLSFMKKKMLLLFYPFSSLCLLRYILWSRYTIKTKPYRNTPANILYWYKYT